MLNFFSFLIVLIGCFNWFFIAAFQYDFIAGFFGTQSSLFSRLVYFVIGMAGFIMLFKTIQGQGTLKIFGKFWNKKQNIKEQTSNLKLDNANKINEVNNFENNDNDIDLEKPIPIYEDNIKTQSKEGYKDFDASKYDNN